MLMSTLELILIKLVSYDEVEGGVNNVSPE